MKVRYCNRVAGVASFIIALLFGASPALFGQEALQALQSRASGGDPRAQVELGLRYIDGDGVRADPAKAAEYFRKAALQGDAQGQLELGVMYVNGEGFASDLREGYAWYWLSSEQGNTQAREYLNDLNQSLSPAEREKAKARAAELAKTVKTAAPAQPHHGHGRAGAESESKPAEVKTETKSKASGASSTKGTTSGKSFVEGKDYTVWERVRLKDSNGFAQPVEAYSILLPRGWRTEGGVTWVVNAGCPADAVQNRVTATSPDGKFRLEVFPQKNWQWYDDPMLLQNAQRAAGFGTPGCTLAQPFDAGRYLEQVFVPTDLPGASIVSHQTNEEMQRAMLEQAQKNNALFQASGVNLQSRPSAEIGRLRWADGRIGIALCAVDQTIAAMPNLLDGRTYQSYQCRATVKTVLSAPAGQEKEAQQLLSTIVASTRVNPEWQNAVQNVFNNIAKVEMRETAKRAAIWRQTQNEINEIHQRSWENSQASQDRINEAWSQTLRGVDSWKDPDGGKIELNAGYNEAWSKGDGTYILSNDPLFDPNVAFQENWKRLEKDK